MRQEDLSLFEEEDFKNALNAYESMRQNGRSVYLDADELTDIARYYFSKEEDSKANEAIQYALSLHPNSISPRVFMAQLALMREDIPIAKEICENITEQNDCEVVLLRIEIFLKEECVSKAIDLLKENIVQMTDGVDDFMYDAINILTNYQYYEEALQLSRELYKKFPQYNDARITLCDSLIQMGETYEALGLLELELDEDPYNVEAWVLKSECNLLRKNYEEAVDDADYALAIDEKNSEAMLYRAEAMFYNNNFSEALKQFEYYTKFGNSKDNNAKMMQALCLMNMGHYSDALDLFQPLVSGDDKELISQVSPYIAYCFLQNNEIDFFLSMLKIAVVANPDGTEHVFKDIFPRISPELYIKYAVDKYKGGDDDISPIAF